MKWLLNTLLIEVIILNIYTTIYTHPQPWLVLFEGLRV